MAGEARIAVSLREGTIEIEGSESFVVAQLARFETLITKALEQAAKQPPAGGGKGGKAGAAGDEVTDAITDYPNLFAVADGKVQITKTLPGSSTAQKMLNAAFLLTYANLLQGIDTTTYDAVREVCTSHGCLDAPNFAKTMRSDKEDFIISGTGQGKTLKLSVPGRKKVTALAKQLNGA